jgi:hypothetical protein
MNSLAHGQAFFFGGRSSSSTADDRFALARPSVSNQLGQKAKKLR